MNKKNGGNGGSDAMVCYSCHGCQCGGRGWMFFLLRTLVTIFILMIVFWFGVAAGALGGGRYYLMHGWSSGGTPVPMMQLRGATSTTTMPGLPQNY